MEELTRLFLRRSELMRQTFYNQPAWDENNFLINLMMDKMSIPEINQAWDAYMEMERERLEQ
ncbi:hypothetical protein [Paenibacillus sp. FSL R10-2734]|uniref:hypothetical protein n=1 Tax=Paenibacillus sp. FSL R10-2734 TaxID=2954691 RepID=UPI0030DB39EA